MESILYRQSSILGCGVAALWAFLLLVAGNAAFPATNAPSLSEDPIVRSWQTKDGLPQNTVRAIVQTRDGYLWVGTGGGVARFDGVGFRAFGLQDGLASLEILTLLEDRRGVLWVGTSGGGLSRWENGRFTTFSKADGFAATTVEALAADGDGTLWIGTPRGLVKWRNGVFKPVGKAEGLPEQAVRALLLDSKGVLWVSVLLDRLYQGSNGRFVAAPGSNSAPSRVYSLAEDRQGSIWAGAGTGWLWQLRDGIWTRYGSTNGLPTSNLESLTQGGEGPLWVGARNSGLYFFSEGSFHWVTPRAGWSGDPIRSLLVDRDGTLWVGTVTAGLNRLSRRTLYSWGAAEGLGHRQVTSVAEDASEWLWVTTSNGGIYIFENRRFSKLDDYKVSGNYPFAYVALATGDGSIWVGGEQSLYRFRAGQETEAYLKPPVRGDAIRAMCEDGQAVWLGTYYSALLKFEGGTIQVVATNGSFGAGITSLVRETSNTLWVGSANGLYHWAGGKVRAWTTGDGLLCASILALHRDPDGTLWIGTQGGGLARLKEGRIVNITTRQGLADDVISQIIPDGFGHLWLGCNRGIMRLEKRELDDLAEGRTVSVQTTLLGQNEGMLQEQCAGGHSPTAIQTKAGRLLFPTVNGIVEIDPGLELEAPAVIPQASIEEVKVDGRPQPAAAKLVIPPGGRHLEVSYAAPSLRGGDWISFRFRLEPLDRQWVNAGARRTAFYPDLRPGDYVFRVTASDHEGNWNHDAASLAITVRPYYWQTLWFQALAGLAVCGAAFGLYLRRVARLEERRAAQEAFTGQLILSQENERKRVAYELHDGLGQDLLLIKNRVGMLAADTKHPPEVARQLGEISTSASRAIADVRAISHALRPSALEQVGFTKAVEWMLEQIAEASPTKFSTELQNIDGLLGPDMEINLYRIVQEALNNVMKHAQAAQVIIEIKREPAGISVSIFDNGRGFDPEQAERQGDAQPSFGLTGMKERARVLGGSLRLESAPGTGTRLTLNVPLGKDGK